MKKLTLLLILMLLSRECFATSRSFDGANDEIDMGNVMDVTTGDVASCSWVKMTEDASADIYIGKKAGAGAANAGYMIMQGSTDVTNCRVADGVDQAIGAGTADFDGVWAHICMTYNGGTQRIDCYENGTNVANQTNNLVGSITTTSNLQFGENSADGDDTLGLVSHSQNYLTQLTAVEIAELYFKPDHIVPTTQSNFSWWPLWGTDSPEIDGSGNARSGTIVAGTTQSDDGPPVMFGQGLPL